MVRQVSATTDAHARHVAPVGEVARAVGESVRWHRRAAEITQEQLGAEIGVSASSIIRLEQGARAASIEEVIAIAVVIGVPLRALLDRLDAETQRVLEL